MSEIKAGEYIRTKKGEIGRIIEVDEDNKWLETTLDVGYLHYYNEFIKYSKKILDLIENGDILRYRINNLSATKIGEVKKYKDARSLKEYLGVEGFSLEQIEILGIITKEQFRFNSFKVKEDEYANRK